VHVAAIEGNAVAMAVEGNTCTTTRTVPRARILVIGNDGVVLGSVNVGDAAHFSGLAARSASTDYVAVRDTAEEGIVLNTLTPGGAIDRTWVIAHQEGTCDCPWSSTVVAPSGSDYAVAWAGDVEGVRGWFLHVGPYFDEAEWGPPPDAAVLPAVPDRPIGLSVFEAQWAVAYVPSDLTPPFRVDLVGSDQSLTEGWSADVPGEVTWVAVAPLGHRLAVAWVEVWEGASAPAILRVGVFERAATP
jgi:hypothetical protein